MVSKGYNQISLRLLWDIIMFLNPSIIKKSLQNINKKNLIPMILSLQKKHEEVYNSVLVEMRKLNESFSKLQAEVSVTKQVKTVVSSKLFSIERQW